MVEVVDVTFLGILSVEFLFIGGPRDIKPLTFSTNKSLIDRRLRFDLVFTFRVDQVAYIFKLIVSKYFSCAY